MEKEDLEKDLAEKAREAVKKQTTNVEGVGEKKKRLEEKSFDESESKIPFAWDPREIEHLVENRKSMSNKEIEKFMEKDSELHEKLEEIDEWDRFSRWEERLLIQRRDAEIEELASDLGRDEVEIEAKKIMMGIQSIEDGQR